MTVNTHSHFDIWPKLFTPFFEGRMIYGYHSFEEKHVVIPENKGIGGIYHCAFSNKPNIESVVIPEGVKYIGGSSFAKCTNLKSVTLPNSLEYIDNCAFCGCTSLSEIVIPENVKSIGAGAFINCVSLTHVKVPYTTNIEVDWFGGVFDNTPCQIPFNVDRILHIFSLLTSEEKENYTAIGDNKNSLELISEWANATDQNKVKKRFRKITPDYTDACRESIEKYFELCCIERNNSSHSFIIQWDDETTIPF